MTCPRSVEELARAGVQSTTNTSQHRPALRDASTARVAEVERAAHDSLGEDVDMIGREDLLERLAHGDVVLVEVRPEQEYEAGHIELDNANVDVVISNGVIDLVPDNDAVFARGTRACSSSAPTPRSCRASSSTPMLRETRTPAAKRRSSAPWARPSGPPSGRADRP